MRKIRWLPLLLFFTLSSGIAASIQAAATRETVLQILKDYSPDGFYIVDSFEKTWEELRASGFRKWSRSGDFMAFVKGETEFDIVKSLGVVVHETFHDYCHTVSYQLCKERFRKMSLGSMYDAYYAGNENTILVKRTKVFNTREIAASIPDQLRTFRFMPYVTLDAQYAIPNATIDLSILDPSLLDSFKNLSSQVDGVYGLLNEFNAYYVETRTKLDLYSYYQNKLESSVDNWVGFINEVDGCSFAHGEFKLFILKYLLYAKSHYPKIYKEIIKNRDFCQAFLIIEQNYSQVVMEYYKRKEEIYEKFRQEGLSVSEDEDNFYIKGQSVNKQVCHFLKKYDLLKNELAKEEYELILKELRSQ